MRHKVPAEQRLAEIRKVARSDIRLAYSVAADAAINDRLPFLEDEFWYAFTDSQPIVFDREAMQIVLVRDSRLENVQPDRSGDWAPSRIDPDYVKAQTERN